MFLAGVRACAPVKGRVVELLGIFLILAVCMFMSPLSYLDTCGNTYHITSRVLAPRVQEVCSGDFASNNHG